MAKLTLNPISSGYASNTAHNTNNSLIETALENTLSRDGTTPNTMEVDLDLNGNKIINLKAPTNNNDAARLIDIQNNLLGGGALLNGNASENFSVNILDAQEITTEYINGRRPFNFPVNLNGNFQVAQVATSFATPANGAYDLDGWQIGFVSSAVTSIEQATGSSAGKLCRLSTVTTADTSIAAGDFFLDQTKIEGSDIVPLVGNTFTVSFRAKFPVTGIHCVSIRNGGATKSYVHEVNCLAANTWTSYSFTVTGGIPDSNNYTDGVGLSIAIMHMAGTTFTGTPATPDTWMSGDYLTTANQVNDVATVTTVWALEDFRIDLGTVPGTDWPSYQESLVKCQRYLPVVAATSAIAEIIGGGGTYSTSTAQIIVNFGIKTRVPPTGVTVSSVAHYKLRTAGGIVETVVTAISFAVSSKSAAMLNVSGTGTPYTANQPVFLNSESASASLQFTGCRL